MTTSATSTPSASTTAKSGGAASSATTAQPVPFMSTALTEDDINAATEVLRSGMLRQATKCAELEDRIAKVSNAAHALTCANGTTALQLAYGALLKPDDEVLVPAWTFIATASMIVACGCKPVFCDVHEDTFQINVADAEARITPNTKAIAVTHLYGCPVDIDAVEKLAKKHNLKVIYDAAQAHLARYNDKGIGAFGDAVTYSFYATKNLATGEGGMVTTNDADLAKTINLLRSHGETEKYVHGMIGYNYRMNDITAAIGCSRLNRLEAQTEARRAVAARYDTMLETIEGLTAPTTTAGAEPVYHLYTVKFDPAAFNCTRNDFCDALRSAGVPTAVHYPRSLSRQPAFEAFVTDHPPVADTLCDKVFCLPMHADLTDAHLKTVSEALTKVASKHRA
jgi:dTDP-4-amino-4,6-dideoxygalactose transaminase